MRIKSYKKQSTKSNVISKINFN